MFMFSCEPQNHPGKWVCRQAPISSYRRGVRGSGEFSHGQRLQVPHLQLVQSWYGGCGGQCQRPPKTLLAVQSESRADPSACLRGGPLPMCGWGWARLVQWEQERL